MSERALILPEGIGGYNNKKSKRTPAYTLQHLSAFSIKILELIRDNKGATNSDICAKLGQTNNYIKQYLYNLAEYGFIFRRQSDWKWYLLDPYPDFLKDLDNILYLIYTGKTTVKQQQNKSKTTVKQNIKSKQLTLQPFLEKGEVNLSDPEITITNLLLSHYNRTKEKFIFIEDRYDLCERLGFPPDVIEASLRKLRQEGICYLWRDREYGKFQLRLKPAFIKRLEYA